METGRVLWRDGTPTALGAPGGLRLEAFALNEGDELVGFTYEPARALLLDGAGTSLRYLPSPDRDPSFTWARGINDAGVVVGRWHDGEASVRATAWRDGGVELLPTSPGAMSVASDVNESGVIAGTVAQPGLPGKVVLWEQDRMVELSEIPGGAYEGAVRINNRNQVLAVTATTGEDGSLLDHWYLWENGTVTELRGPGGTPVTAARGINDNGLVVGVAGGRAVAWRGGQVFDLNEWLQADSGWTLVEANGVNDLGQIVGTGYHADTLRPFLLSSMVPEPTAMLILASAVCLLRPRRSYLH